MIRKEYTMKIRIACILCSALSLALMPFIHTNAQAYDVPTNNAFKAYMSYLAIKDTSSKQYAMQQTSTTDQNGLRVYNGRYCIAVGTYYAKEVGVNIDVTLEDGTVLKCVTGDIKQDVHTDSMNRQVPVNGNVVEFIIDPAVLNPEVKSAGDVSEIPGFSGEIIGMDVHASGDTEYYTTVDMTPPSIFIDTSTSTPATEHMLVTEKYTVQVNGSTTYLIDGNSREAVPVSKEVYDTIIPNSTIVAYNEAAGEVTICI